MKQSYFRKPLLAMLAVSFGALGVFTSGITAADADSKATATAPALRVFIDPETGERRAPNTQERQQMATGELSSIPEPELIERDGMRILRMPPERKLQLRGRVSESGAVHLQHETGAGNE